MTKIAAKKMICMTPGCASWCTKWWICSWSYWLSTSLSTKITFFSSRALSLPLLCFGCCNFWKFIFHKVVQRCVF